MSNKQNERAGEPESQRAEEAGGAGIPEENQEQLNIEESSAAEKTAGDFLMPGKPQRDFDREIAVLRKAHPDIKELPQEVLDASVQEDSNVLAAYEQYRNRQLTAEVENLRKENLALKQNAEAAARAPVTAVSSGGSIDGQEIDPFIAILSEL